MTPQSARLKFARTPGHRAFTLVELLMVIGLIVLIATILIVSVRKMQASAAGNQTKTTLSNLRSMFDEYRLATSLKYGPANWWWRRSSNGTILNGGNAIDANFGALSLDFWNTPYRNPATLNTDPADPLLSPGSILENAPERSDSPAIKNTLAAVQAMLGVSNVRNLANGLPNNLRFVPDFTSGNAYSSRSGLTFVSRNKQTYRYIGGESLAAAAPPSASWDTNLGNAPFTLLDGWQNPIIFVPSSGLETAKPYALGTLYFKGQCVVSASNYYKAKSKGTLAAPTGASDGNWTLLTSPSEHLITAPDGKPFWASAGTDGDFSTTDDNVYSFEN